MKKILAITLFFVLLLSFAIAEETQAKTVVQMTYIVKMPDVIREGKYSGETQNGIPHGYGVFVSANSEGEEWHYLGEWLDGEMSGKGACYWDGGQSQVGTWEHNDMVYGEVHSLPSYNVWMDSRPDENDCLKLTEYRADGTILFDGCVKADTGLYHEGTVYTKDGKVFFSGEIGEGFDWNYIYVDD